MKLKLLSLLFLSSLCWGDSIPLNGNTGQVTAYRADPLLLTAWAYGTAGGYVYFSAFPAHYGEHQGSGALEVYAPSFTLEGNLSHVVFNSATGQLQAVFYGIDTQNGVNTHLHGTLFESVNLATHTPVGGYLVVAPVPEPGTIGLLLTGLAGIWWKRRL